MTTKVETLLDKLERKAIEFGVDKTEQFPADYRLEIYYSELGQGSIITDLLHEAMQKDAADQNYRIKMIPSDKKLIVELL